MNKKETNEYIVICGWKPRFIINLELIKKRNSFVEGIFSINSKMARQVDPLDASFDKYTGRAIFRDSDKDDTGDIDGDSSNIDFEGINEDGGKSNEEAAESNKEEQQWTDDLCNIAVDEFSARSRIIVIDIGADSRADDVFTFMFGEYLYNKIEQETNCYACQELADNECLGRWWANVKAYLGECIIMGMTTGCQTFLSAMREQSKPCQRTDFKKLANFCI